MNISTPKGQREYLIRRVTNLYNLSHNSGDEEDRQKAEDELNALAIGRNGDFLMHVAQTVLQQGEIFALNIKATDGPTLADVVVDKIENHTSRETKELFQREVEADYEQAVNADLQEGGPKIVEVYEAFRTQIAKRAKWN